MEGSSIMIQNNNFSETYHSERQTREHILVCLSSAPSNLRIVQTGARMSEAFHGTLTALYVQTPDHSAMSEEDQSRLKEHMRLAEQLGASIETVYGDDVSYQIAEFSRLNNITKIVLGRSNIRRRHLWSKPSLTEKLTEIAPNLDIYIIPDAASVHSSYHLNKHLRSTGWHIQATDLLRTVFILISVTLTGLFFYQAGLSEANIITLYILGVLLASITTTGWSCSLLASACSVIVFNYFFTTPRFTFHVYGKDYPVTFIVMFVVALLSSALTTRLKDHARQSAKLAYRTKVLFDTNQLLQKAETDKAILNTLISQIQKLLGKHIIIYPVQHGTLGTPILSPDPASAEKSEFLTCPGEREVALWVLSHNKRAGAYTDTFPDALCHYLAIRVQNAVYGVAGMEAGEHPMDSFEYSVLVSILGEGALAMENRQNIREKEQAALLMEKERLRANLLRTISHDLRTPLTAISGNASNLLSNHSAIDEATRLQIYADIYDDSMWLINLVENLLAVTRIEDGRMNLRMETELVSEVISEALRHVSRQSVEHSVTAESTDDLLLARMDARLIVQVIINLVDNAIKYTQKGSRIQILTDKLESNVRIRVTDDGPGIPDEAKPFVFDMCYTGANRIADSRRSLGLGLCLCRSIIRAHGGEISVSDNTPSGCIFTFTLPCEEVAIHE